ncbi:MAG: ATP-binding protein [Nitrospirae bacterium]|nr:ATP-binding protein [Nitrospirota bacterium]
MRNESLSYPRLLKPPAGSFFLFGPRGTGKSTWLRRTFPEAHYVDLLDERKYQAYLADAGLFAGEVRALRRGTRVVIDEIQRLPSLLNEVHRHIEEQGLKFALCGSSARKLRRGGVNLLGGRAVQRFMHPLVPEELGGTFHLDESLRWGSLPVVLGAESRSEALEAYAQTYLREEIQAEALVRNLPGFARFLPVAALFHGRVLNVSSLARDAGVTRTTAIGYLDVLEDTLLAYRLPAFEGRLRVRERRHPKLYWADPGLPRAIKKQLGPATREEMGPLLEGWLAGVLRAYRDYRGLFDEWWYWAPAEAGLTEVDFLLRRGRKFLALEVKSGRSASGDALRGLRAIQPLPGLARRILAYGGDHRQRTKDGIDVLPLESFLQEVESGRLF